MKNQSGNLGTSHRGSRKLDKKRYEEFMSDPSVHKGIAEFEEAYKNGTLKTITYEELLRDERKCSEEG